MPLTTNDAELKPGVELASELQWLEAWIGWRLARDFSIEGSEPSERAPAAPPLANGPYGKIVRDCGLDERARLVLALALAPHLAPHALDPLLLVNQATGRRFTEFGGQSGQSHGGLLPTAETALFLVAGRDPVRRLAARTLVQPDHPLFRHRLLRLDRRHADEPPLAALLTVSVEGQGRLLSVNGGKEADPPPGPGFPAHRITTALDWPDLVLKDDAADEVAMIARWLRHGQRLMVDWRLDRRLKPGYRCLFYGPPGTGKTLTACLLGKAHDLPVYRVDLSRIVSKWIGETEKNLAAVFDQAEHRRWILFFDEADALFGKRTQTQSSNDRYANQEVAFLLQRLEDFPGLVILATNLKANLDEAFSRRFQSSILFAMPDATARERLWRETFNVPGVQLGPEIDFQQIAARYELAGGAIVNVLRHAALLAADRDPATVLAEDILEGIRLETRKQGRYPTQ